MQNLRQSSDARRQSAAPKADSVVVGGCGLDGAGSLQGFVHDQVDVHNFWVRPHHRRDGIFERTFGLVGPLPDSAPPGDRGCSVVPPTIARMWTPWAFQLGGHMVLLHRTPLLYRWHGCMSLLHQLGLLHVHLRALRKDRRLAHINAGFAPDFCTAGPWPRSGHGAPV